MWPVLLVYYFFPNDFGRIIIMEIGKMGLKFYCFFIDNPFFFSFFFFCIPLDASVCVTLKRRKPKFIMLQIFNLIINESDLIVMATSYCFHPQWQSLTIQMS